MAYVLEHTKLGFCLWDLLALIVLVAVIAIFVIKVRNQKQEERDLEDQLSGLSADETVPLK